MNAIVYLMQVSACTAIFYLFYYLLLSRLTFFRSNRYYLLSSLLLSFVIPVLSVPVNTRQQQMPIIQQAVYVNTLQEAPLEVNHIQSNSVIETSIDWVLLIKVIYLTVVIILALRLILSLTAFLKKIRGKTMTKLGQVNILRSDHEFTNGSFFNYIFLNEQALSSDQMQQIIAHELLHVKLYHSFDRLVVKVVGIILWFNPFSYAYRRSIEENHEFEVDREITTLADKQHYAKLLVQLSVPGQDMLYHSFSKVPLKKRIAMLFNQPSIQMKKTVYALILPVLLISCLAFARLKKDADQSDKKFSVIDGIEKLGDHPLVMIDGKEYGKDILYKIGKSSVKSTGIWAPDPTIKKHGIFIKDGFVEITTNGKISYATSIEKENLLKERSVPKNQFYTRLRLKKETGGYFDKIIVQIQEPYGASATEELSTTGKAAFFIDGKLYSEKQIEGLPQTLINTLTLKGVSADSKHMALVTKNGYEAFFALYTTNADTIKYRQKVNWSPIQRRVEEQRQAYRKTDDFQQKEKLAKAITGKTIAVKVKDFVDKPGAKDLDIMNTGNHRTQGFTVIYDNHDYFLKTAYGQEKQLAGLLKPGDEITLKVFGSAFSKSSPIIIEPAFVEKNQIRIFQLAEAAKIPDYPFLYEVNKVRFADGQITHIQKYPNGKWKSAQLEIVNGYRFFLSFKSTAPRFADIEEDDHVRLRFVHEAQTSAKTYAISDWVSLTPDIKDYGIKNPELFGKYYTKE